ncbi:MAG: NTP transferase domain-containing protein [Rhodospirillales bacterium]|nr:NTP transferase domain-containing protein [Rhodospirillales bacterium]
MTTVAVIQARHTSSRLPGKMILPLAGIPVIEHSIQRIRAVSGIDKICITIPEGDAQAPLAIEIESLDGVHLSRGPEEHLLTRFVIAARETQADTVIRLWGDCPAVDPALVQFTMDAFAAQKPDWAYLNDQSGWPLGSECQVLPRELLETAAAEVSSANDLEAVHTWFDRNAERFTKLAVRRPGAAGQNPIEVLLDTRADYAKLCKIFERLYPRNPLFGMEEVEALASSEPELFISGT